MKKSIKFYIVGTLLLAPIMGLVANQVFAQPSVPMVGENVNANDNRSNQFGRYQLLQQKDTGLFLIFDTATGKCWKQTSTVADSKNWKDISPVGQ